MLQFLCKHSFTKHIRNRQACAKCHSPHFHHILQCKIQNSYCKNHKNPFSSRTLLNCQSPLLYSVFCILPPVPQSFQSQPSNNPNRTKIFLQCLENFEFAEEEAAFVIGIFVAVATMHGIGSNRSPETIADGARLGLCRIGTAY